MFIRTAVVATVSVLCLGLLEGGFTAWAWLEYKSISVERLNEIDRGMTAAIVPNDSTFAKSVRPHPYLGITTNIDGRPPSWKMSDVANFPAKHDESKFTILLTGGSVAALLGGTARDGIHSYLDEALDRYDFGKPVVVLNAAAGATNEPREAIAVLLYGRVADATISVEGFNELWPFWKPDASGKSPQIKFGKPGKWFEDLNPIASGGNERIVAAQRAQEWRDISSKWNSRAVFYLSRYFRRSLEASVPEKPDNYFSTVWLNPGNWNDKERFENNIEEYRHCIRMADAMSTRIGLKRAYFIQPVPGIGKTLTDDERRLVGPLTYAETYQAVTDRLVGLNSEGIPVVSLLDTFNDVVDSVYIDQIHNNGEGQRIMAERIASELARLWHLKPKP